MAWFNDEVAGQFFAVEFIYFSLVMRSHDLGCMSHDFLFLFRAVFGEFTDSMNSVTKEEEVPGSSASLSTQSCSGCFSRSSFSLSGIWIHIFIG